VRVWEPHLRGSAIIVNLYYFLAGPTRLENSDLILKGPNCFTVLFTYVFLDVLPKHDDGVVVLFHAALRALYARLEPFHDAFCMKNMLALEFLVGPFSLFKTDGTCVGKVGTAHAVLDRFLLALGPVPGQCGAIHGLI